MRKLRGESRAGKIARRKQSLRKLRGERLTRENRAETAEQRGLTRRKLRGESRDRGK